MKYERSLLVILHASLAVLGTSAIYLSRNSAVKYPEETFMVTCKDESGLPVTWSGPKGHLGAKTQPRVEDASYGTSLYFNKLNFQDTGNYTCTAGSDRKVFQLSVKEPLTFMDTSPIQHGKEFTDVTLRCEVKGGDGGADKPIVTWNMEDGSVPSDPRFQIIGDGLVIKNITRLDSKIYVCKATQTSTGDIREQKIQLKVEHKPEHRHPVWAKGVNEWGFLEGYVNLTCEVVSEPPPTFEWRWKKQILHETIYNFTHKSVLQIYIKDATLFGNYVCIAKNRIGTLDTVFSLQQGIRAEPPDFIEIRGANSDLIDIGIHGPKERILPSIKTTGYRVEYKTPEEKYWKVKDFSLSEDNSYPLRELHHDTGYEVRVATLNKAGASLYTNTSVFHTLPSQTDGCLRITPPCLFLPIYLFCILSEVQW